MGRIFMFRNEVDMLRVRLQEFARLHNKTRVPVRHILVEAPVTHRGVPKSLVYQENQDKFGIWVDVLRHLTCVHTEAENLAPWQREHIQRDCPRGLLERMVAPEDTVLISDVDEIPSLAFMKSGYPDASVPAVALSQKLAMYAVDWVVPDPHVCSVAVTGAMLHDAALSSLRDNRHAYPVINHAGWHLTWLGGPLEQAHKLSVTCHEEMREDERERIASGECYRTGIHHAGDLKLQAAVVDETWPERIYQRRCPDSWFRPQG